MIGQSISGYDECFVCGYEMQWETRIVSTMNRMVVQRTPEVTAEECAIGKNENGEVIFEVECVCPRCRTKNRFKINRKV